MGSLGVILFTFINFQTKMSQVKAEMEHQLVGNPFRGFADVAMQSIQFQWGWALLIVGTGLVIAAAEINDKDSTERIADDITKAIPRSKGIILPTPQNLKTYFYIYPYRTIIILIIIFIICLALT